ncbi:MAG: hypothetical protein HY903_09270 [Deltaproteobacteria bacterium]|nr:hypothetical protein [Deltaproteobacteria bacterium]
MSVDGVWFVAVFTAVGPGGSGSDASPSRELPPPSQIEAGVPQAGAARPAAAPGIQAQAIVELRRRLPAQLAAAKATEEQRRVALALLDRLEELLGRKPQSAAEQEGMAREYLARGGELRDLLDDWHLPDPGDLLPPGPRSRLGIVFRPDPGSGAAVVTQILPQYRADKMGMAVGDLILTLNGAPVAAKDLIESVVKAKRPYVIEVTRHGRRVVLEEPKAKATP